MHGSTLSPGEDRRSGVERRGGVDRRSGGERRAESRRHAPGYRLPNRSIWVGNGEERPGRETQAADRSAAIAAHHRELSARLGRNVGLSVAALDYLLNISRDLVAPAIVEHDVLEALEHRAVTDPLTGLFNRYHFDATLKREVARCLRSRARLSLLLMDVDQLKAVNDRWGHQAGDGVLGRVAGAIQSSLRSADIAVRYGGDEFAIILPDTDAKAGRIVAERICTNVRASLGEGIVPGNATGVTVSGGLAELPLTAGSGSEAQLIVAADRALYLAKGRGGNCVAEEVLPWGT